MCVREKVGKSKRALQSKININWEGGDAMVMSFVQIFNKPLYDNHGGEFNSNES